MLSRKMAWGWAMGVFALAAGCNAVFGVDPGETDAAGTTGSGGAPTHGSSSATTSSTGGSMVAGSSSGTGGTTTTTSTTTTTTTTTVVLPASWLLADSTGPSDVPDGSKPFETDTVKITRAPNATKIVLAEKNDGSGTLYVDDNIHVIVTPEGGTPKDQYYEFWVGYPCPSDSTTVPPGGSGSGLSPAIDITSLFAADTTHPQEVKLEFWHCAAHTPAPHSAFYLVEL